MSHPPIDESTEYTVESSRNNHVAKSLDGRLLCAAECAYLIENPYFRGVGYTSGNTVKRISRGVNSCLIGRNVDGIIVAFRGTVPGSPLDWLQNAAIQMKKVPSLPGRLHYGFHRAVMQIYRPLVTIIKEMLEEETDPSRRRIFFTGHSKGGCLASITALKMNLDPHLPNIDRVVTFGASRVGDREFRRAYDRSVRQISYENDLDMVPFLPPGSNDMFDDADEEAKEKIDEILWEGQGNAKKFISWDYQPVGKRIYIDKFSKFRTDISKELVEKRIQAIEDKTIVSVGTFRRAHTSVCLEPIEGGAAGYFSAIAPEICTRCSPNNRVS